MIESSRHFGRQHRASDRVPPKGAGPAWLRHRHGSVGGGDRPRRRHCLRAPGQAANFQSGKPSFWVGESAKVSRPLHVAFVAPTRAAVDVSIMPRSRQGALTTGRQVSGPNTTPPITQPSC